MRPVSNPYDVRNMSQDDGKSGGKELDIELSVRQYNIIGIITLYPTITIPELAGKMAGKVRTIERDIAFLQSHDIIRRVGGRKDGRWEVL